VGAEFRERNRAFIMLLKDSGLRVSDVSPLDVGDYRNARDEKDEAGESFRVFDAQLTKKKKIYAYIHIGPETVTAMDEYLRVRQSEEGPLGDDEPLFTQRKKERATAHALSAQLKRLCELLGKDGYKVSAHSLRKYHETMLLSAPMSREYIYKLQGKKTDAYNQPEKTGNLTKSYKSSYESIRVNTSEAIRVRETDNKIADLYKKMQDGLNLADERHEEDQKQIAELMEMVKTRNEIIMKPVEEDLEAHTTIREKGTLTLQIQAPEKDKRNEKSQS
jgi:hypothetical protein